jgi:hypothetical protein
MITSRISDHFPVILTLSCNLKVKTPNKFISRRKFPKANEVRFKTALNNVNWNVVEETEDTQLSHNIRKVKFNKNSHKIEIK